MRSITIMALFTCLPFSILWASNAEPQEAVDSSGPAGKRVP